MWMIDPEFVPSEIYRSPSVHYMLKDDEDVVRNSNESPTTVVQASSSISEQGPTKELNIIGKVEVYM